jgi:cytoskeletal protein RodZ
MGVSIVVLPLILSLVARFARGARMLLGIFALLLLLSVAAQIWLGALLMLDSPIGTITRFNEPEPSAATADDSESAETTDTAAAPTPRDATTRPPQATTSSATKPTTR